MNILIAVERKNLLSALKLLLETEINEIGHIEEVFNEINSDGMNKVLNRFFNSIRELSNQPENETVRTVVKENAQID